MLFYEEATSVVDSIAISTVVKAESMDESTIILVLLTTWLMAFLTTHFAIPFNRLPPHEDLVVLVAG